VHLRAATADLEAGARGRLIAADAPRAGEYLVVEVRGDRLPFSATELALPPTVAKRVRRAAGIVDPPKARRAPGKAAPGKAAPSKAAPSKAAPSKAAPSNAAPSKAAPSNAAPSNAAPGKAAPSKAAPSQTVARPAATSRARAAAGRASAVPAKAVAAGRVRRKTLAPVALTVAFDGARWTVEARSGTRRVRPVEVPAAAAAAAASALGVPDALALVSAVTDAMRLEAELRAATLREQLAAAEAELAHFERA
jgi:hypothetical protein